jgi:BolA family transcriptional regulator, general stress-responsive regulator
MTRADRIKASLAIFAPNTLIVEDESAKHAGHAGASLGGETHYAVHIVSDQFTGLSRVERQRRINQALAAEFQSGLHALSLKALTAFEASQLSAAAVSPEAR